MRRQLVLIVALPLLAACTDTVIGPSELEPPSNLTYELLPSGDPEVPDGILLRWDEPNDDRVENYVVYSRGSTGDSWSRRAETTSASFHDTGLPHLQYFVTAQDFEGAESSASNTITVEERNRLPAPSQLISISLDRAVQLSWSANARLSDPSLFDYYRVYSTLYDLDAGTCDGTRWALEGSTVSEDFLATGLPNGVPRCFAVSAISWDGHESLWTTPRADTPRPDARNVVVFAVQASLGSSGFRFQGASSGQLGAVLAGDRGDIDFRVERHGDGSLWFVPVRAGTRVTRYGTSPVADLTSIDIAPLGGFSTNPLQAVPGFGYVFETTLSGALHFGAVRVTHVSSDYVILDWSYQTDPGNPELNRMPRAPEQVP
ncbi:MAG: fibronectin type III domain-containing protein [Gemmatimonadaceae bacterium]